MFFFLQSLGREAAIVRLQSEAVVRGLRRIEPGLVHDTPSAARQGAAAADWLVIHYSDARAIKLARQIKQAVGCRIICFGSDVYDIRRYVALDEIVDHFLMPTPLHRDIVGSAVWHRCDFLPEGIDPIAMPDGNAPEPVNGDTALGWFGYGLSFGKALAAILPRALANAGMTSGQLTMITTQGLELLPGAVHLPFSTKAFYQQVGRLSHVLLSHFAHDGHVNSYIKSPNKLVTTLVRGLTPVLSGTPAYLELAQNYELENLTFRNGPDLSDILSRLPELRLDDSKLAAIAADLHDRLSPERIARRFLELID